MTETPKKKRYVRLPKPKHAEEYSLEECAKFQPWKVVLKVEISYEDDEPRDYEVYLRASGPDDASYTAYHVFNIWEHAQRPDREDPEYPRISTRQQSEAFRISEDLYASEWKIAQKYDYLCAGDRRNPTIFRYVPKGWDATKSIVLPKPPALLMPTKAELDKVTATKNLA